jgi:hypothetical protein
LERDRLSGACHDKQTDKQTIDWCDEMIKGDGENRLAMPVADRLRYAREESQMNTDYVFFRGVMWAQHASVDAREELIRTLLR